MMTVGGVNGAAFQGVNQNIQTDSVSRNLQNQIARAQKELQELSSKEGMTPEEKRNRRQEIQQEISSLNQQLRQHQIERRKEQQSRERDSAVEDLTSGNHTSGKESGLSQVSMQAMISADFSVKQSQVQGSVATRMEGRARVLEVEIKQDAARGGNVEQKKEELADMQQKAQQATSAQVSALASADRTMKEAAQTDQDSKEEDESDEKDRSDTYIPVDVRL